MFILQITMKTFIFKCIKWYFNIIFQDKFFMNEFQHTFLPVFHNNFKRLWKNSLSNSSPLSFPNFLGGYGGDKRTFANPHFIFDQKLSLFKNRRTILFILFLIEIHMMSHLNNQKIVQKFCKCFENINANFTKDRFKNNYTQKIKI